MFVIYTLDNVEPSRVRFVFHSLCRIILNATLFYLSGFLNNGLFDVTDKEQAVLKQA